MLYKSFMINDTVYNIVKYINEKKLRYYLFTGNECLGVWDNPRLAMNRSVLHSYMNR